MAPQMKIEKPVFIATIIIVFFAGFYFNFFFANQGVSNELNEREDFNKELINEKLETLSPKKLTSSTKIVAVTQQGQGVVSNAEVEIIEGKGRLLFNTNPFVEPDTQFSLDIAREVAQRVTGKSLADRDIIYSINDSESKLVGGPSAGAAFTLITIAAMQGKKARDDTIITGTINRDGSIGPIGGVIEKLQGVADIGGKTFLIPKGQRNLIFYQRAAREEIIGNTKIIRTGLVPLQVDLVEIGNEIGVQVIEVENIEEAINLALI